MLVFPTVINITITTPSGANQTAEVVTTTWDFSDVDADTMTSNETTWYNQTGIQYYNMTVLPSSSTAKGQAWITRIRVFDATEWSLWTNSTTLTILNTPSVVSNVNIESDGINDTSGNLSTSFSYSDADGDSALINNTIWYKDDTEVIALTNLTSFTNGNTSKGEVWIASWQTYDGEEEGRTVIL